MKTLLTLNDAETRDRNITGGKTAALAALYQEGIRVPETFCVPARVYGDFLSRTRLKEAISFEIHKKPIGRMRWEEIWDVSLRIRNLFLTTPMPRDMEQSLTHDLERLCGRRPMAVRSSSPGEDGEKNSFAGAHESFLNVASAADILKHIKLVWASLYSDAALMYRKEMGLEIGKSAMAVIVQELIPSDRAGIFFSLNPSDSSRSVIESVYGLNQGLVDGDIDPDRWVIRRASGKILSHARPARTRRAAPGPEGVRIETLPESLQEKPPLDEQEVRRIWETGMKIEKIFDRPQDVEWAMKKDRLTILQARPITSSGFKDTDDKRVWYLSLHRSHENLKDLREKIENRLIPKMIRIARRLEKIRPEQMPAARLAKEIRNRQKIYDHWVKIYWDEFIPFAHSVRLFGQIYNDAVRPDDPYEFMTLLERTGLKSMERNRMLEEMADLIRNDPALKTRLEAGEAPEGGHAFSSLLSGFVSEFGDLACQTGGAGECHHGNDAVIRILLEFSKTSPAGPGKDDRAAALKENYINAFPLEKRAFAKDILDLGRAGHRLRDDDNIHLGLIETRLFEAVREGRARLENPDPHDPGLEVLKSLPALSEKDRSDKAPSDQDPAKPKPASRASSPKSRLQVRQIAGNPAGPGLARGPARVIAAPGDLLEFKRGEVLVCEGVDPNMTFVIPLAAAVVEERGGMLIHGAIIARERGLPCVTGALDAASLIQTGDRVTVDGYLGIVTRDHRRTGK
ncbi:Pyruvate, water dikinase [Candidatus Desulfarcum epimagneticum]|uniref:Phosphoenolpyruvate synthase n=1 Tax=uncultured Desulfobacteraceae bacterium TaxID=218296 RepID=A0A484HGF3_9BACT|nr:Pyruvate, water dikinase [uncultured Desulfobacteraceae bacterium]